MLGESYGHPPELDVGAETCAAGASEMLSGSAWQVNDRVQHDSWGPGVVMRCETDRVTVLFEQVGYKTLKLDAVHAA